MEEMVGQLRSLKLNKTELAAAAQLMPFFDQVRMDPKKYITLLNRAAVQSLVQDFPSARFYCL